MNIYEFIGTCQRRKEMMMQNFLIALFLFSVSGLCLGAGILLAGTAIPTKLFLALFNFGLAMAAGAGVASKFLNR